MYKNMLSLVKKISITLLIVIIVSLVIFLIFKHSGSENTVADTRIINHELQRLNKMIVIEQNYSAFRTKKYNDYNPRYLSFLNKNIVLYITAKAQVTYDMKKMKVDIDSIHKKIHLISIPAPELQIYPNVEIYSMEDGLFNRFSKSDLNTVMEEGKNDIKNEVEKSNIKTLAQNQLITNLKELYATAKLYDWEVVDDTPYAKQIQSIKN